MPKNNLVKLFSDKNDLSKKLICYFPVGDPVANSIKLADTYINAGADVLEIGLAVDNPYLDGKVVTDSMERTKKAITETDCYSLIKTIRKNHPTAALEIMCYKQIFNTTQIDSFSQFLEDAKIDALLVADNTSNENIQLKHHLPKRISLVSFMPYESGDEEFEYLNKYGDGFIFLQAVNGSTGKRSSLDPKLAEKIKIAKERIPNTPICPGFGISTPEQCEQIKETDADGLIIGSAIIEKMIQGENQLRKFIVDCKDSLR